MNQFIYTGTSLEVTDAIRSYVEKRMSSFFKNYDIVENQIHIEIGKTTNHHKNGEIYFVEANFKTNDSSIYARSIKEDIYEAIDHLEKEVYSQLEMNKGKRFALFKKGAKRIKNMLKFGATKTDNTLPQ